MYKFKLLLILLTCTILSKVPYAQSFEDNARLKYMYANELYKKGDEKAALDTLLNILPDFNSIDNDSLESRILGLFGHLHKNIGNDTVGIKKFLNSLKSNQIEKYMQAVQAMGHYFLQREAHTKALLYFRKMMLFARSSDNYEALAKSGFYSGKVFKAMHNLPRARTYFQTALKHFEKTNNINFIIKTYNELGEMALVSGNEDTAVLYLQKLLDLAKGNQSEEIKLIAYHRLSNIIFNKGNLHEAQLYIKKAIELASNLYPQYLPSLYLDLGRIKHQGKKHNSAISTYKKAIIEADKNKNLQIKIKAYQLIGDIYSNQNRHKLASKSYKKALKFKEVHQNQNSIREMARFEARYNLMQKEQEIKLLDRERKLKEVKLNNEKLRSNIYLLALIALILLAFILFLYIRSHIKKNKLLSNQNVTINEQNEELNQINQQLSESENKLMRALSTKNKLFAIIGHDLKSPLIDIKNLIFILKNKPDQFSPDELKKHAGIIEYRLTSLLELLNNLLNWGMSERNSLKFSPEDVNINQLFEKTEKLFNSQLESKEIKLTTTIPKNLVWFTDYNMLEFIIRNTISNAIKFSPVNSEIRLNINQLKDNMMIQIEDEGIGMDDKQLQEIFSQSATKVRRGTNNEKGTGLGMTLTYDFISQMGGTITVQSKKSKGTKIDISLPKFNSK